ncbi:subclass B3 metallo-beta-lactamase SAM-1 [Simiduia agarivorans]|uniref:Beta-lactamase-like protein n=1 Tax=Simiduia agarivorans (strain DSM 21679 / JCM 13881 / BCRC 17597 / SA1) TaxID=1117647 RepID=K4KM71_SIMAS|nr:subclass B3 metallo-beta-lactamase [Simiduia agarivorans]AFV00127.1 beta-lactamase-like protein [Simiduia agarivorans SA1 = DSM 21679]6MFI_A Chain A, Metallo-beta-lactamase [Simiduia agarivorans SA1 = DSM 21679]
MGLPKGLQFFLLALLAMPMVGTQAQTAVTAEHWVDSCADWDAWDKPGPPFRVLGNTYYVGTCGIAAILITGDAGHVLIDSGTDRGAVIVRDNIARLGFSLSDVKILLHSHEHIDHVGGMASLQSLSGATLYASPAAAAVMRNGTAGEDDPQAGALASFPVARVGGLVNDGDQIALGNLRLTAYATPGHTPGALSWQWRACEEDRCTTLVYADSLSPVSAEGYRFNAHPEYLQAYRLGLATLADLECDLLLTPHPSASQMRQRLSERQSLAVPDACRQYATGISARLAQRLASEAD